MKECTMCEYNGYSPQLCKMHLRHLNVAHKQELSKKRQLALFDKKKMIEIIKREEKKKKVKDLSLNTAVGTAIGTGGGFMSLSTLAHLGGAVAAHAIAGPVIIGAAVIGGSIGIVKSLKIKKKQNANQKPTIWTVYGFKNVSDNKKGRKKWLRKLQSKTV